jgi:hypothetical protein
MFFSRSSQMAESAAAVYSGQVPPSVVLDVLTCFLRVVCRVHACG